MLLAPSRNFYVHSKRTDDRHDLWGIFGQNRLINAQPKRSMANGGGVWIRLEGIGQVFIGERGAGFGCRRTTCISPLRTRSMGIQQKFTRLYLLIWACL